MEMSFIERVWSQPEERLSGCGILPFSKVSNVCLKWILAQIKITPSEGEDGGEGGQLLLPKLGLWDAGVFLNGILMSVCDTKHPPLL